MNIKFSVEQLLKKNPEADTIFRLKLDKASVKGILCKFMLQGG